MAKVNRLEHYRKPFPYVDPGIALGAAMPTRFINQGTPWTVALEATDYLVIVGAVGTASTLILPTGSLLAAGKTYVVKTTFGGDLLVSASGTDRIDSTLSSQAMNGVRSAMTIAWSGAGWNIV